MATLPIVINGAIMEVRYMAQYIAQRCINVVHYRMTTVPPNTSIAAMADSLHANITVGSGWAAQYNTFQNSVCINDAIEYQVISPARLVLVSRNGLGPGKRAPGQFQVLPPNTALAITKQTLVAKRGGVGHFHVFGFLSADIDVGKPSGNIIAACDNMGDALVSTLTLSNGATATPVILNRKQPPLSSEIGAGKTEGSFRTMRRRTVGVGI